MQSTGRSTPDPGFEIELSQELSRLCAREEILGYFRRFDTEENYLAAIMRRACVRALARSCGNGLQVGLNVGLRHPETMEFGDGVVIGEQTIIQGRFDGNCQIGNQVWIGPQSYFDARDLVIGDQVGWGPGAKVLGSEHTAVPIEVPIIATDLQIAPVQDRGASGYRGQCVSYRESPSGAVLSSGLAPLSRVMSRPTQKLPEFQHASSAGENRAVQVSLGRVRVFRTCGWNRYTS